MNHVTSIGPDVHARFITAVALDSVTGEVSSQRFGYSPAELAAWISRFESPKAVYESGVTGFHLVRELRALGIDCVVGAVSKMRRPASESESESESTAPRGGTEGGVGCMAASNVIKSRSMKGEGYADRFHGR